MCGRYAITLPPEAVRAFFRYVELPNFPPRYNVAPTQPVPIIRLERDARGVRSRHFVLVRWGFLPGFVKDPKDFPLVINARAETVAEKPSFRNALKRRRCIFIADAFYEWRRPAGGKKKGGPPSQPFLIRRADGAPMALAGLWEAWTGPNGEEMDTACIVTTDANGPMAAIHDRMPVILEPEDFDRWLDCEADDARDAAGLMRPTGDNILEFIPIGTGVNKVANDGPEVQAPVGPPERPTLEKPMRTDLFG
jgi:putative SOS response-associated peptidase YedK